MKKLLFVLILVLGLAAWVAAQETGSDVPRTNLQLGPNNEATDNNSQYITIRVTLAGVIFQVSNSDWQIGNNTVPGSEWYAWPENIYHNASGSDHKGVFPPSFVTGSYGPVPGTFANDMPIIWNKGGVALDFLLGVSSTGGWIYESKHSSNRLANDFITSGQSFLNAMQVRAVFMKHGGTTSNYNDANYAGRFNAPGWGLTAHIFPATPTAIDVPELAYTNVVYTTAMITAAAEGEAYMTSSWTVDNGAAGAPVANAATWFEATSSRFSPLQAAGDVNVANHANLVVGSTSKGLNLPPDRRTTIALELLTPRKVTRSFALNGFLATEKILKLRVWGTPSDATGN